MGNGAGPWYLPLSGIAILPYLVHWTRVVQGPEFMPLINIGHYSSEDISIIHDNRVNCIHSGTKNDSPIIVLGGSHFQPFAITQEMCVKGFTYSSTWRSYFQY
jgi:hypothetical protein